MVGIKLSLCSVWEQFLPGCLTQHFREFGKAQGPPILGILCDTVLGSGAHLVSLLGTLGPLSWVRVRARLALRLSLGFMLGFRLGLG